MSENKVFGKLYRPKKKEGNEQYRILHNEELHDSFRSPSVDRIVKCKRLRWARHVDRMGEASSAYRIKVMRIGDGWNWLRIVSNGGLVY
jgi:hypothetical protein